MNEVKLDHAKRLLRESELRMWEIAEACLMTQEHFATFFRKNANISPSAYRRKRKNPAKG
jgi:transcriptional regulator GlxA family with amidase domain